MCISLRDNGWTNVGPTSRLNMHRVVCDGANAIDVYSKSQEAIQYARTKSRPVLLLVRNIVRRFGHAATDRQFAYMSTEEIERCATTNHFAGILLLILIVTNRIHSSTMNHMS
jgi:hypothetical protein